MPSIRAGAPDVRVEELNSDVMMFVGESIQSVATAFIDRDNVLLVDSLGSAGDAEALRRVLCHQMGKTVRMILSTHFMSDHIAGLSLFPEALVVAHRHFRHAFLSQNRLSPEFYREPDLIVDNMALRWGRHQLRLLYNPGKTMDHFSVDVPTADLVCVGDNIVGNIVYLSKADSALQRAAIGRIRQFGRSRVVGGHMGVFDASVLANALHYLARIQDNVVRIRMHAPATDVEALIAAIRIEDCLSPQVVPSAFEREWHQNNLDAVIAQSIFALDASLASLGRAA
ncbi:MBL fold metallo-hydrolase [Luteimonas sp. SDU101]|uniref:MBL fold metallo-hydrolase n=1 Tax=Luteimonas sp. SDU101 TaxID=3422593 RepID=UPI003EB8F174